MDFRKFEELGSEIDAAWQRVGRDEHQFPEIALAALRSFQPPRLNVEDLGRFLLTTKVRQQPQTKFSNLPVMLFRGDGFHLEILVWTKATTTIHQHRFSGAFRLLEGSSLQSGFRFTESKRINSHLLLGDIEMLGMQLVSVGDCFPIVPGREGLIHSLFHLDEPSMTLVARTGWDHEAGPQYDLVRPGIAFDSLWADEDAPIAILQRWLGVSGHAGGTAIADDVLDRMAALDPVRLFSLIQRNPVLSSKIAVQDRLLAQVRRRHPELAELLPGVVRNQLREDSLTAARRLVTDADLRFFLALLLNAQSRDQVFDMIRAREPGVEAEARCIEWLFRLGDPSQVGKALRDRSHFLLRLGMAMGTAGEHAGALVSSIIHRMPAEAHGADHPRANPAVRQQWDQAERALRAAAELAVLL